MTYETVIHDLFAALPAMEERYRESLAYMEDEEPLPYLVFGAVVVPALEQALALGDLASILRISAFLEEASEDASKDPALEDLLRIEVGDWLGRLQHEDHLAMWLGPETKRICGYVLPAKLHSEPLPLKLPSRIKGWFAGILKKEGRR